MILQFIFLSFSLYLVDVSSQGCANTCPPLNDIGVEQESLCEGDDIAVNDATTDFETCYGKTSSFQLSDFEGKGRVTVVSNYYFGCNAGRRESGVYAHIAQRFYDEYQDRVTFIASNKGASCQYWANKMAEDAVDYFPGSAKPEDMPIVMDDTDSILRDLLFTPPFGHPSYVVFDGDLQIRNKFIGPCCGKEGYNDCTSIEAKSLNDTLTLLIEAILDEDYNPLPPHSSPTSSYYPSSDPTTLIPYSFPLEVTVNPSMVSSDNPTESISATTNLGSCEVGVWSSWSGCSATCGDEQSGLEFRWRIVKDAQRTSISKPVSCPSFVETRACTPTESSCDITCTEEIGSFYKVQIIADGFEGPRDVAFHPIPGYHLGNYSEGRAFPTGNLGDGEAWVLNGHNHSISIVSAVRSEFQTTFSRRDRGYYHYMVNATALSFNSVKDSGRNADRDSFSYWAVCNDNLNTYLDKKEANYFMGPTLYDSSPLNSNTVNRLGHACTEFDQCFFLHADMLHEAPACIGIAHDPEMRTAFGNVYWAFDATGNGENGQLVRFDFQQPHGPGSMDHSIASVRRYPEVKLRRGDLGMHAGIVVHQSRREVYIASPGDGTVIVVGADSGSFARIAREEYPIYSNRLPSFEYSIWECVEQRVFASNLAIPSGMALSNDGERLFVAEQDTGRIFVYEIASATILHIIETGAASIQGMAIAPNSNTLYFVDSSTNTLNAVTRNEPCLSAYTTRVAEEYSSSIVAATKEFEEEVGRGIFNIRYDSTCIVETDIPNVTYFEQVHADTGYASNDTDVQASAGMDSDAYLLANRTDCGYNDNLNFDALLLGGFYCHPCLPITNGSMCDDGGTCENVQWSGYTCDNHFVIDSNLMKIHDAKGEEIIYSDAIKLDPSVTYRFDISGDMIVYVSLYPVQGEALPIPGNECGCAQKGPLLFKPSDLNGKPRYLYLLSSQNLSVKLSIKYDNTPPTNTLTPVNNSGTETGMKTWMFSLLVFLHMYGNV